MTDEELLTDLFSFLFLRPRDLTHHFVPAPNVSLIPLFSTPTGLIITSALMIWKSLILFTGSESPVSFSIFRLKKRLQRKLFVVVEPGTRNSPRSLCFLSHSLESQVVVVLSGSMEPGFHRGDILFLSSAQKGPPISSGDIVVFNIGGRGKKKLIFFLFWAHRRVGRRKKNSPQNSFQNSLCLSLTKKTDIPIVHRVIKVHDGGERMVTGSAESINEKSGKPEIKVRKKSKDEKIVFLAFLVSFLPRFLSLPLTNTTTTNPPPPPQQPTGGPFLLTKGDNNWGDDRALYARGQRWLRGSEHVMGRVVGFLPHVGRVTIVMNDYPAVKYVLIGVLALFVVTSKE